MNFTYFFSSELDVTGCTKVTDAGIKGLCVSVDKFGREDKTVGLCKRIEKLTLRHTSVTKVGTRMALENLSNLKILICDSLLVLDVLADIHQEAFINGGENVLDFPNYSLTELNIYRAVRQTAMNRSILVFDPPYRIGSLRQAVALCPLISEVHIVSSCLTNVELLGLLKLKGLRKFSIEVFDSRRENQITFDGGVRPLLEGLGSSLTSLKIDHLNAINIGVIVEHCSNLRNLSLIYNTCDVSFHSDLIRAKKPVLEKLERLNIIDPRLVPIPPQDLLSLLSSPSLKQLRICRCPSLTDGFLLDAANVHGFQKLESIDLQYCPNVTKSGIDLLMNESNPLSDIGLMFMQGIRQQNVDEWKAMAIRNNWQLEIQSALF